MVIMHFELKEDISSLETENDNSVQILYFPIGSGLGVATTIATVYTMEIATPNLRGRLAVIPAIGKLSEYRTILVSCKATQRNHILCIICINW